jgi:uncharacterized protein
MQGKTMFSKPRLKNESNHNQVILFLTKNTHMKNLPLLFFTSLASAVYGQQPSALPANTSDALYAKGLTYSSSGLVLKDIAKARNFYYQAADQGNSKAMLSLGSLNAQEQGYLNVDSALYWYNAAAAKGNNEAWLHLGNLYHFAQAGVVQDFGKAYTYYQQGAAAGDINCIAMLGYYHYKGLSGKQNYALANSFFTRAAEKGNPMATYYLGLQYRNGYGVQRDTDKATELLSIAAKTGQGQAKKELEIPQPENPVTPLISPVKMQQNNNSAYQRIKHNLAAGSLNGNYKGYAIRYDWSATNIISIFPLEITFRSDGDKVTGTWNEENSVTDIEGVLTETALLFNNTAYNKKDHYSEFKGGETWQFNNAKFNLLQEPDSVFITGNLQLYSHVRREPGKPLFIYVTRATTPAEKIGMDKTPINITCNNPFSNTLAVSFNIPVSTPVTLQLVNQHGQVVYTENAGTLQAGTYRRIIEVSPGMSMGSYVLELVTKTGKKAKMILKQ